jgi:hypothetical protein
LLGHSEALPLHRAGAEDGHLSSSLSDSVLHLEAGQEVKGPTDQPH